MLDHEIRNRIKRMIPSSLSCKYKELQVDSFIRKHQPNFEERLEQLDKPRIFFLYDACFRRDLSGTKGRIPKNIYWDRWNPNLENHFYTDDLVFNHKWRPNRKYGLMMEPETLQPRKYRTLIQRPELCSEFEYIFTSNNNLLMRLPNAKPLINGGVYIGTAFGGGSIDEDQFEKKSKNISIVSSEKRLCELHRIRYDIAKNYEHRKEIDCFGTFNGGKHVKIADSLVDYRYSIVIENDIQDYWITEKICNCFATMTIPIYLGSPKIGDFFNLDGILILEKKDVNDLDSIIKECCEEDYRNRLTAVIDNFNRVKRFLCMEDWLENEYRDILP